MGKQRKSGNRGPEPDEYFRSGPIEVARFGKTMIMRSNATKAQFEAAHAKMVENFPRVVEEIDLLVNKISTRISRLPADRLLHRGWWEFAAKAIMEGSQAVERSGALRMIDYVQSVLASTPRAETIADDLSDEEWALLGTDIQKLFHQITSEYQICLTAERRAKNPDLDMELEDFRFRAETMWMHVRGKRYQNHECIALGELLKPHSDIFETLFGVDAEGLVEGFDKILRSLSRGASEAVLAAKQLHEDSIPRMEDIAASPDVKSIEDFNAKLWEDPEFSARRDAVAGLLFGLDLFDVAKLTGFPSRLIDELTWDLGEEPSFFASGEFRGWPLRIWPTMMRPFIRLDGKSMCFDMWSLFDNIYRAIQRITCRLDPDYRETWNARQKAVTEQLPFKYFENILPGMQSFTEVNYRWKSSAGKAQWHECDGLIVFDDHLFVLEVKAGAFTYTSPATDLAAHLSSLKGLLEAPANQGSRFVEYLESANEVAISDKDHNEIAKLKRADFRHVTIVAITLDAFTELAARAQHLRTVGVDVGNRSVWSLSIDDLRVYADLCTNPLMFLHFVEQRMAASKQELIDLNDEVDHYGLYLEQNNYSQFAAELISSSGAKLNFNGYRVPIDEFYSASMHGEKPAPPQQVMPRKIFEIIDFLGHSLKRGRSQLASFLLDAAGDFREEIAKGIEDQLDGNRQLKRQRPILISGENPFTICTSSPDVPRDKIEALDYCRSLVAANGEKSRLLLELEYDSDDKLVEVNWQTVTLSPISLVKNISASSRGIRLRQKRVSDARMNGKIPVNSMCPCGSGKKYKKCCRV